MTEVRNQVLTKLDREDLAVYISWEPQMGGDLASAERAAERIVDRRVTQFWDGDGALGKAYGRALKIPGRADEEFGFGWDLFLVYEPGQPWSDPAPLPAYTMLGLMLATPDTNVDVFDGVKLRQRIEQIPADSAQRPPEP